MSIDEFLARLTASGLLSADETASSMAAVPRDRRPGTGEDLARELVRQRTLTRFQAEQLIAGKGKSLTLGNYIILDKLGQGGMGMVLKARHKRMGRVVALKVMSSAAVKSSDSVKRFHREVQTAAKLTHPNMVTAYDADEAKGTHFLVMEFVEGDDLSALVKRHGPMSVGQAIECMIQAARGLAHAHSEGVIHRDIKPANLLLDKHGTVKILDMGLARLESGLSDVAGIEGAGLTQTGTIMGTVDYMSPEQAEDTRHADARADIYSLGCSLFYLLTGRAVYDGETMMKKLLAHRDAPIPSLEEGIRERGAGVSEVLNSHLSSLNAVFQKMVAKRPGDRYQTMGEVIADLERCRSGEGVTINVNAVSGESGSSSDLPNFLRQISGEGGSQLSSANTNGIGTGSVDASAETMLLTSNNDSTDPQTEMTLSTERLRHRQRQGLVGVAIATVLVLLIGLWLLSTPKGVLQIEISDAEIEVTLGETGRSLRGTKNETVKLPVGEYVLHVELGETTLDTPEITVAKGEQITLKVERFGNRVRVIRGKEFLVTKELPKTKASGKTDLAKSVEPQYALRFDGMTSLRIPKLQVDFSRPATLEGFITPQRNDSRNSSLICDGAAGVTGHKNWAFGFYAFDPKTNDRKVVEVPSQLPVVVDQCVHVALVSTGRRLRLYVDGKLAAQWEAGALTLEKTKAAFGLGHPGLALVGLIREVRVSQAARYDKNFTPPVRFRPDADTLALYHFDEGQGDELKDSSGNGHHGKIVGAKWAKSGRGSVASANYSLELGRNDHVTFDGLVMPALARFTWEAWVTPKDRSNMTLMTLPTDDAQGLYRVALQNGGPQAVVVKARKNAIGQTASKSLPASGSFHLAVSYNHNKWTLWINGTKIAESASHYGWVYEVKNLFPAKLGVDSGFAINPAFKHDPFQGTIDELRISTVTRYEKDFAPAPRFEPDNDTLALYHFDEGGGDVLKDSSGNNHHGQIVGAKWVKVDQVAFNKLFMHDPAFPQWVKNIEALPAEQQVEAVSKKLVELNPGFDGKLTGWLNSDVPKVDKGVVAEVGILCLNVTDISPVRAFRRLDKLSCSGGPTLKGKLSDLSPVVGMPLTKLDVGANPDLSDLSPLRGLKLAYFACNYTAVNDLTVLQGMPLTYLHAGNTNVANLSFLKGMPLEVVYISGSFSDLSPLRGMRLRQFHSMRSQVTDLSPLKGMPLSVLGLDSSPLADLSPLAEIKELKNLNVRKTKITPAQIAALQKALPDCKIILEDPAKPIPSTAAPIGPAPQQAKTSTKREVASDEWIDVLPLIDPALDKTAMGGFSGKNDWRVEQGELKYVGDSKAGKVFFPVRFLGRSLEWEIEFTRATGSGQLNTDIPLPGGFVPISVYSDKITLPKVTLSDQFRLVNGQRAKLRFRVTQDGANDRVELFVNDAPAADWKGRLDNLKYPASRDESQNQAVFTGVSVFGLSNYTFHAIRARMLNGGTAELLRPALAANTFTNSLGMEFVRVPKGKSWLGGGGGKPGTQEVTISDDFYLGKFEVTQEEWEKVMGRNPASFSRIGGIKDAVKNVSDADLKRFPVETVSWDDAQTFLSKLNERDKQAGWEYRLPTSSEWEYGCRGGPMTTKDESSFDYYLDQPTNTLPANKANFVESGWKRTQKVGSYPPNRLGLHDMHGNVAEWCHDAVVDAKGTPIRRSGGGSFMLDAQFCRAFGHGIDLPDFRHYQRGLRLARVPVAAKSSAFVPLLNGKDLTGWRQFDPKDAGQAQVVVEEGQPILRLSPKVGRATRDLGNYHLRFEYKTEKGAGGGIHQRNDAGILTFRPPLGSPPRMQLNGSSSGISYQEAELRDGRLVAIGSRRPNGEKVDFKNITLNSGSPWQRIEIIWFGDSCLYLINGKLACAVTGIRVTRDGKEKPLGPHAVEFWTDDREPAQFRNIEVREITALPDFLKSEISNSPSPFDILTSPDYEWSAPENLGLGVNSASYEHSLAVSADGLILVLASRRSGGQDLFECRRQNVDDRFGTAVPIKELNTPAWEGGPFLSADGLTLLFHSQHGPNEQGNSDLYQTRRRDRNSPWENPVNLGSTVNTPASEEWPCLSSDGLTLLFSSERPGGKGGFDVWRSRRKSVDEPFETPENLGSGVNSGLSDVAAKFAADNQTILFVRSGSQVPGTVFVTILDSDGKLTSRPLNVPVTGHVNSPTLLPDARTLYFTTPDFPGGLGSYDGWQIRRVLKK